MDMTPEDEFFSRALTFQPCMPEKQESTAQRRMLSVTIAGVWLGTVALLGTGHGALVLVFGLQLRGVVGLGLAVSD